MKEIFTKLNKSYDFEKKHDTLLSVIEILLAIALGGLIGYIVSNYSLGWLVVLIVLIFLVGYLAFRRISKATNFSVSGLGELKAMTELDEARKQIGRQKIINEYLDEAILSLNSNTCTYNTQIPANNLCDSSIEEGFKSVCRPLVDNPQTVLDVVTSKFSVGVCLDSINENVKEDGVDFTHTVSVDKVLVLRDDYNLSGHFSKDIIHGDSKSGLEFYFQKQLQETYNNEKFVVGDIIINNVGKTYITAPIPTVCEDGSSGVVFIICDKVSVIPDDAEKVFLIFNRLFCNWITKYNECVEARGRKADK